MLNSCEGTGNHRILRAVVLCLLFLTSIGCAHTPLKHGTGYNAYIGDKAVQTALSMVEKPYKYRGETPSGFDCSGLVRYSYLAAGMDVPHNTSALREHTRPVSSREMRKGDLVFFNQAGRKYSHVGIYVGEGRFVHAPSTGNSVRTDSIRDPYWKKHFLGARRLP